MKNYNHKSLIILLASAMLLLLSACVSESGPTDTAESSPQGAVISQKLVGIDDYTDSGHEMVVYLQMLSDGTEQFSVEVTYQNNYQAQNYLFYVEARDEGGLLASNTLELKSPQWTDSGNVYGNWVIPFNSRDGHFNFSLYYTGLNAQYYAEPTIAEIAIFDVYSSYTQNTYEPEYVCAYNGGRFGSPDIQNYCQYDQQAICDNLGDAEFCTTHQVDCDYHTSLSYVRSKQNQTIDNCIQRH